MTQISDSKSTGGVLQIPAAATQKNASTASRKAPKPPAPRLKLLVRRLPPGLTQSEFENALGSEWMVGAGRVDWHQYKPGKVSKESVPALRDQVSTAFN
jgi:regulator of nonsense transcripts 3